MNDPLFVISVAGVIGGIVGYLSGLFGVGGGFLLVPVLHVALGISVPIAVGSTSCYTLGLATTAVLARRPSTGFFELPLILSGGLLVGVWTGTSLLRYLHHLPHVPVVGTSLPLIDLLVLLCYAVLMSAIAVASLLDARRTSQSPVRRRGLLSAIPIRPLAVIPDLRPGAYSIPLVSWMALGIGFLSGFLGMSGGLILIPAAVYLLGLRVLDAATLTIVIVWIVSFQSTAVHAAHGHVDLHLVSALLICGATGAHWGSRMAFRVRASTLKYGFFGMVCVALVIVTSRLVWLFIPAT